MRGILRRAADASPGSFRLHKLGRAFRTGSQRAGELENQAAPTRIPRPGRRIGCGLRPGVIASTTLQPVNPADPPLTVTTTRYAGGTSTGLLAFEATPTDCQTGVSSAGIEGFVGLNG